MDLDKQKNRERNQLQQYLRVPRENFRPTININLNKQITHIKTFKIHPEAKKYLSDNAIYWLIRLKLDINSIVEALIKQSQIKSETINIHGRIYNISRRLGGMKVHQDLIRPFYTELWNNADFEVQDIADILGISRPSAKRLRNLFKLEHRKSFKRPYLRDLLKRIRKLYYSGRSTINIGKLVNLNNETIRNYLKKANIEMRHQSNRDVRYNYYAYQKFKNKLEFSPRQLNAKIKQMAEEGLLLKEMTNILKIDRSTITRRMKALGFYDEYKNHFRKKGFRKK
jgi:hypothetical protein